MVRVIAIGSGAVLSLFLLAGCSGDGGSSADGGRDVPVVLAEDTAAMCGDGRDNDGDGFTDCADQDCWPLNLCAASRPDGWQPPDSGVPRDGPRDAVHDQPQDAPADGPRPDGTQPEDGSDFDTGLQSCSTHCDCAQGQFCYKGQCIQDPKMDVYCCAKPGCPPGATCMDLAGQKSRCVEDAAHVCQTACDCGPAHCCIDVPSLGGKRCVKDTNDPWLPGGTAIGGASCNVGTEATYCCTAADCHAGRSAYGDNEGYFRCFNPTTSQAEKVCGATYCKGTACDCEPGEVCVETVSKANVPAGSTCNWDAGGSCVSWAAAEAIFGWSPSDLLACCKAGCTVGSTCDAGWQHLGSKFAYQRVVGSCGPCADGKHHSCGKCGNGTCDPGEFPKLCPADCHCGDGVCAPEEVGSCEDCGECADSAGVCDAPWQGCDCDECGDGWCSPGEVGSCAADCWGACQDLAAYPQQYTVCGDGVWTSCSGFCNCDCPQEREPPLPATWVTVSKGTFSMGSPTTEACRYSNEDQHSLTLTRGFQIQSTEVTQAQFEQLMGYNPSYFTSCVGDHPNHPVETVNWYEAAAYCNALSQAAGLAGCYDCTGSGASVTCAEAAAYAGQAIYDCPGFRLPTEAEWEHAYRAGTTTAYYSGANNLNACACQGDANLDPIAWYCGNANSTTHPVGTKQPNAWGLFDMAGNVWEWCNDWYQASLGSTAATDPFGSPTGSYRVKRGGAYNYNAGCARASYRNYCYHYPTYRYNSIGFRCLRIN